MIPPVDVAKLSPTARRNASPSAPEELQETAANGIAGAGEDEGAEDAARRAAWIRRRRRTLLRHAGGYVIVNVALLLLVAILHGWAPLWLLWLRFWWAPVVGAGAGVAIHAWLVLTIRDEDWNEERARREEIARKERGKARRRVPALPPRRARVAADTGSLRAAEEEAAGVEAAGVEALDAERPRRRA